MQPHELPVQNLNGSQPQIFPGLTPLWNNICRIRCKAVWFTMSFNVGCDPPFDTTLLRNKLPLVLTQQPPPVEVSRRTCRQMDTLCPYSWCCIFFSNPFVQSISVAPPQIHYYSETLPTQKAVSEFRAEAPQATASEGLVQGPSITARAEFEPATHQAKYAEFAIEPYAPTSHHAPTNSLLFYRILTLK